MKNILLATDLDFNSDRALERALKLANEHNAKLHILHVAPSYASFRKKKGLMFKSGLENLIRAYLDNYKDSGKINPSVAVVHGGETFSEILDYASAVKADLVVMGIHGKARFRDLFVGTTLERVVRKGNKPVLLVKNKPLKPYNDIAAGIDFTPSSRSALRMAMELSPKAHLRAIHAFEAPVVSTNVFLHEQTVKMLKEKYEKYMDAFLKTEFTQFTKEYGDTVPKLTGKVIYGLPHEILVKHVKKTKSDLLTIGAHTGLMPLHLSEIAQDILANPPCDVLVVRE